MPKILLVEDVEALRDALSQALKVKGHTVLTAGNGKIAKDILGTQKFDLIISDIQMPFCDGLELLEWVKGREPTKFLLMTGFSNLIELKSAHARGADEFLNKPFKVAELNECIKRMFPDKPIGSAVTTVDDGEAKYCKISIDEFVARPTLDFDVYIRLSDLKHIKIGHAGGSIPKDQIQKYKDHGEHFLYVKAEDFSKLLSTNMEIAKMLKGSRAISKEKKLSFMRYTGEILLEKVFVDGADKNMIKDSSEFLNMTVATISENADFVDLVELMSSHSDRLYAQCISAALYTTMIARKMGITASQTFFKLSMAGLFHEVGLKEIDRELLEKSRPLLTTAERKLIESHPMRGNDILLAMGNAPSDVVQMVLEHHEDASGTGYPRNLKKSAQHPLSSILQLAALFAEVVMIRRNSDNPSGAGAVRFIEETYADRVDPAALKALKAIFSK